MESLERRVAELSEERRGRYIANLDMSWIMHDAALEGSVYTTQELRAGLLEPPTFVADSSIQPAIEEIRRHKEAVTFVRDTASKKKLPITVDTIRQIYAILHPEEGDAKTAKYRRDSPQHRLYFHDYAPPDKIQYRVRQIIDWVNDPETKKGRNPVRMAARAHYDLLRVFPFQTDSGKVARLFMNLLLMRHGYPPAIVHLAERQRYYDALKGVATLMTPIVQEAAENTLASMEKLLEDIAGRVLSSGR